MSPVPFPARLRFAALLSSGLTIWLTISALAGCLALLEGTRGDAECDAHNILPTNITAVAGDGAVTLTWDIPAYDTASVAHVHTMVLYAEEGGPGEQCAGAHINHIPEGCVSACPSADRTRCTAEGLTNGTSYTFTLVTSASPHTPYGCFKEASTRTEPMTPAAAP